MFSVPLALALAASLSTYAGGLLTLRFVRHRDLLFGLTGGLMLGLALLDLLPEALEIGMPLYGTPAVVAVAGMAAVVYFLIARLPAAGTVGRLTLLLHSFVDGLGIGLAFHIAASTGWFVAAAILAHKVADGANMVGMTMASTDLRRTHVWLGANALVPVAGVALSHLVDIKLGHFSLILALLGGGFLFIGFSELLPHGRAKFGWRRVPAALVGLMIMAGVVRLAG